MPDRVSLKWRISIAFTLIVVVILSVFALTIYFVSNETRETMFFDRLKERAKTTADLILEKDELDSVSFKRVEEIFASSLPQETIEVYNSKNERVFFAPKDLWQAQAVAPWLDAVRRQKEREIGLDDDQQVGILYQDNQGSFVISIRAHDTTGLIKIERLKFLLISSLLISIVFTSTVGWFFSNNLLRPFNHVTKDLKNITEHNLHTRIPEISKASEIKNLVDNINDLLNRLEGSFLAQKVFIANVSHEIRTPLSIILGELEIASMERNNDDLKGHLESFRQEVIRLVRLSEQLLWLAHASRDKNDIYFSNVRIDEIVLEAVKSKRIHTRKVNVNYSINPVDGSVLMVKANSDLLRALFINLLENAIKFTPLEKEVNVIIEGTEERLTVKVIDNGPGISKEEQVSIFKPFYRSSSANHPAGHGIGLYLCKQIAIIHHATISIGSVPSGGATVTLEFLRR
jgi:signal transduction histidine kinase